MAWHYTSTGINTPDTFSNSTDANTLDDFETGVWNGVFSDGSNSGGGTSPGTDKYTKVGPHVSTNGDMGIEDVTGYSGGIIITGLPFTSNKQSSGMALWRNIDYTNGANVMLYVPGSGTNILWYEAQDGGAYVHILFSNWGTTDSYFNIDYHTDT